MIPRTLMPLMVTLSLAAGTAVADRIENPPIVDGQYVTAENGHLSYNGQRVRFWGTHFCCGPKRSGRDLELSIDRMCDAGFNAIRFNLSHGLFNCGPNAAKVSYDVPKDTKGTQTTLNDLDYAIYLAKRRNMFFWLQFCMGWGAKFKPADYDIMPDDGTREQWTKAIETIYTPYLIYLSDRAGRVHMEFARRLLDHVNPYTGRRYGDEETIALWEMFNETLVVRALIMSVGPNLKTYPKFLQDEVHAKWTDWLIRTYKEDAGLQAAWGTLKEGELLSNRSVALAPTPSPEGIQQFDAPGYQPEYTTKEKFFEGYPAKRCEDVLRFYCSLFDDYNKRFINHVRQFGRGIKVVPIAPSGNCQRNITQYYAASQDGFVATGTYGFACRPWEVGKEDPFIPYVNRHPLSGNLTDCTRVAGKPYLVYECNDYRPNPYMVEFPMYMALQMVALDGDGVFWFYWDDSGSLKKMETDEDYANSPLPMPYPAYPNAGLVLMNDEVMLAAIKSAGAIYRQADLPRPKRTKVVIGRDMLFDITKPLLGEAELWLRHFAWRTGVEIVYDPNGPSKIPPCTDYEKPYCDLGKYVHLDWRDKKGFIRIDAPTCKAQVGFNPSTLEFGDTKITGLNRNFSYVGIVAEDGRPLETSSSVLITLAATSRNTGYKLDPAAMKKKWSPGLAEAVVNPGSAPVIVERVSATIQAPWLKGMAFQKHDFARNVYSQGKLIGTFVVTEEEPMFYARLTRPNSQRVKKLLIIGNSITHSGPSDKVKWFHHWGMAASAEDKDFAHLLHRRLCEYLKGDDVQLIVENLLAVNLPENAHRFGELADHNADLVVIQMGDNLPPDQANDETLRKPYELLIKSLRRANGDVRIFGVGTWGGSAGRNELMEQACKNQNVPFVRIDPLIRDPQNKAESEGRFEHAGVNWHPGDRGMQAIADTIWQAVEPVLNKERKG